MGATILTRPDQTRPDQTRPDQTANYDLLYDLNYHLQGKAARSEFIGVNHFIDNNLTFRTIQDGYILPRNDFNEGGIFDINGVYIKRSSFRDGGYINDGRGVFADNSGLTLSELTEKQHIDISASKHHHQTAVYIGIMLEIWGHVLSDNMRLLWFLRSNEYRENFAGCPLVYCPCYGFELKGNWKRLLEILGINTSLMTPLTELTRYDKIILPDECFFMSLEDGTRYFTREYIETIDAVRDFALANTKPAHGKKIYFSHSTYRENRTYGEDKLEDYFASKGYEIIAPEKLSLDEQLNALVHCESFASTIGSCSHNMIFCRDNTEVLLIPRANYLTSYQVAIDQVHPQNIHYIDSSFSFLVSIAPWNGPYLFFVSSNLRKYFHDEDTESIVHPSNFWRYLRSIFGFKNWRNFGKIDNADNSEAYRYYSTVATEYFGKLAKISWPYKFRMWLKKLLKRKSLTQ